MCREHTPRDPAGRGSYPQPVQTSDKKVTVVIADDHPFFRDGVSRGLVGSGLITVLGAAGTGRETLELIAELRPDVALVDYQMPDLDGLEVVHAVVRDKLPTKVLLLSAITESAIVFRALEEGAAGYLGKDSRRSQIVDAVLSAAAGHTVVPPELAGALVGEIRLRAQPSGPVLSERESQVLQAFARGLSIPQTAAELFIGASTVKTHTQRLYEKLGVSDRAAAVAEAMRRGLLE
jgi:two-component system nitrate/nitrite response regulator NarL